MRVLKNNVRRAAQQNQGFAADDDCLRALYAAIDKIVETHKRTGVINDAVFAETKVNSLRRQGRSRRAIQQKLSIKGVNGAVVAAALEQNADGCPPEEVELQAALALVKRRKLGPFRKGPTDEDRRRKDFGSLARAGFSSDIARRVLKAPTDFEVDF